jgi:signal transduction histidine kinase/ligand-binding sensor domain-containing protein
LPNFFIRTWQTKQGLPNNAVNAIVQTRDGYLWLGTYDGLARFDGMTFTNFDNNNTPEMRSSRVVSLFEDDAGALWIGTETGELTRFHDGQFRAIDLNAAWEKRNILNISSDRAGQVWLLNEDGRLARVNGDVISTSNAGSTPSVASLARDDRGALWVSHGGQLFALDHDRLTAVGASEPPSSDYVAGICPARGGGLWIVSGGRLRRWNGREWTDDLGLVPWGQSSVSAALETRSGYLAVGTLEQGVYLLFPNRGSLHFSRANGLPHDRVRALSEDREGTLWVGTGSGGLAALRAGDVATVDTPDHWQGRGVLSVTAARDGALWVGTEGAGLYRLLQDEWTRFDESSGLSNLYVWSVSEDAQGRIWVGTWGGGVFIQRGNHFERPAGLEEITAPAPAVLHARNGATWIGTSIGLLRYQAGAATWIGRPEGLALPQVRSVVEDHEGNLWFGMLGNGLGRLQNGVVKQFRKSDGLSSDYVQCLHLDADGALWIGTYGGGLNRLKQGRFACVASSQGLPNNFISDLEEDGQGNFWISSHGGIFRVAKEDLNLCADGKVPSVRSLSYGEGEGMPSLECAGGLQPAGCRTADGRFWFPTTKGLVVLDPSGARANPVAPPVIIENLLANGKPVAGPLKLTSGARLQIPPGHQRVDFQYTALSFVAPEKVRFQYRLEGLEPEWLEAGDRREINYSYLPPNDYTFRVRASNSDGVLNKEGAALAFTVQPFFWQQWWFRILAGLIAATALSGSVLIETRRRMRLKLERVERQRAIERERARIARDIHDNLGASLTRISLLSQSAHGDLDDPEHTTTQLDRIYQTARDMTRAMDEIVWAVNPQHDTLESLVNYLGKFAQDFLEPLDLRCRLDVPAQIPAGPPLTAEVRHNLFLAFQEALTNVIKHAAATEVCVSLAVRADGFHLTVRDDGKGFTPQNPPVGWDGGVRISRGNGLANMRRRLAQIGGRCDIRSAPGQGTEVEFVLAVAAGAV